jgi:hypothetical protein
MIVFKFSCRVVIRETRWAQCDREHGNAPLPDDSGIDDVWACDHFRRLLTACEDPGGDVDHSFKVGADPDQVLRTSSPDRAIYLPTR